MKRTFLTLFLMVLAGSALAEEGGIKPANTELGDRASLQRGARLFMNYCLTCHSASYMRYARMAEDLGLSEAEVQKNLNFTQNKFGEPMTVAMTLEQGERFFAKAPPDLSVIVRTKESGPDWVYNYLKSFYVDNKRPIGWNNSVWTNASMPNVLWELQGVQAAVFEAKPHGADGKELDCPAEKPEVDGKCLVKFEPLSKGLLSPAEFDEAARDLAAFMQYVSEPAALERHAYGPWVILFLALFTFIAWLLKHEYWKDVH